MAVDLTENDVKILQYVKSHQPVHISQIEQALHGIESISYRVEILATPEYKYYDHFYEAIKNSSYLEQAYENVTEHGLTHSNPLGIYTLTDFGRKALQDYENSEKAQRRELWLKNAWIPILVTIATNLAIHALEWLSPLIQQWLSNIL
jgi:hypothetical protein